MIHVALLSLSLILSASVRLPPGGNVFFGADSLPADYELASGLQIGKKHSLEAWTWVERENGRTWTGVDLSGKSRISHAELRGFFKNRQSQGILRGGIEANMVLLNHGRFGASQIWDQYDPATTLNFGVVWPIFNARLRIYQNEGFDVESLDAGFKTPLWHSKWNDGDFSLNYGFDRNRKEMLAGKITIKIHNTKVENDGG